jgi:transposase
LISTSDEIKRRSGMADPVRARRLSDHEGQTLTQIVRRGRGNSVRVRRATIIMASSSGTLVSAIARLVAADEDTVRDVIHAFNQRGLAALDPRWAGGRPRQISDADIAYIVTTATTRPGALGVPFTHWSVRKLAAHLGAYGHDRRVRIGRERLRLILREHHVSFQRTRTWKESKDPDKEAKLDRIEYVTSHFPMRCFAFDQFGPLSIRPCHGSTWALLLFLWVRFGGAAQGAGPLLPGQGRLRRRCARALRAPLDLRASATPSGRACGQAGGLPGWCAAPPNLGCSVAAVKIVE